MRELREHWNWQALIYAADEGHRRYDRLLSPYEESRWRYIEPVLLEVDAGLILESGCGGGLSVL